MCDTPTLFTTTTLTGHLIEAHRNGLTSPTDVLNKYKQHIIINNNVLIEQFELRNDPPKELISLVEEAPTLVASLNVVNLEPTSSIVPSMTFLGTFSGFRW